MILNQNTYIAEWMILLSMQVAANLRGLFEVSTVPELELADLVYLSGNIRWHIVASMVVDYIDVTKSTKGSGGRGPDSDMRQHVDFFF